ncbi:transposase [Streptomyces sp. NPDC021056]|uniref:transposase n=1 Tax=Streptomyces sp. NPDC021056 TaxID=3155012 RepID=UPI0033F335E2
MPTSYRANLRRTLKSCSRALLNDPLWELLEPLPLPWPDEDARPAAGAGSAVLAGHLVCAAYRDRLEDLPQELGFRSGMTCWRRIKRWINAGVFDDGALTRPWVKALPTRPTGQASSDGLPHL